MRRLELLAPAKDLQCGIAAIDCGADAVYIGAEKFGARAAAGNSIEDIIALTRYAHSFRVKVYVTVNTIIYDSETEEAKRLVEELARAGVDALLVQDMAMLALAAGSGIPLHASTQTDNRSADGVGLLKRLGFTRIVLARELSVEQIRAVHNAHPDIELEAFVHGALCVSYSGACYASHHLFGRSANRGECAQVCRMKFDLIDSEGTVVKRQSHLLSLKDLALLNRMEELADAGITSFKIEGRLKDISYVKNVVAAYNKQMNALCEKRSAEFRRSSIGEVGCSFTPDINKTFNRGYTEYFFRGRGKGIASPFTPKVVGEKVGTVKEIRRDSIVVSTVAAFANGDGLCFFDERGELKGFRVNRAEGNRLFLYTNPAGLTRGATLYRNNDAAFEKRLLQQAPARRIPIRLTLSASPSGFRLSAESSMGAPVGTEIDFAHEQAVKTTKEDIVSRLSRWGGTIFKVAAVNFENGVENYFIPASVLSGLRHKLHDILLEQDASYRPQRTKRDETAGIGGKAALNYNFKPKNIANLISKELHERLGFRDYDVAPEADPSRCRLPLMQTKLCLRYELGFCERYGGQRPAWHEPLFLRMGDGRRLRLEFDCTNCRMNVRAE